MVILGAGEETIWGVEDIWAGLRLEAAGWRLEAGT